VVECFAHCIGIVGFLRDIAVWCEHLDCECIFCGPCVASVEFVVNNQRAFFSSLLCLPGFMPEVT